MTKNMFLDLWREIRRSANRFLSILIIVIIGVSVFAGLRSAPMDMAYTIDNYFDEHNTMDFRIISTLGLTEEDIRELEAMDIVEKVQAGYFVDALALVDGSESVFRINSLPVGFESEDYINQMDIYEGRMPEKPDEIVVEHSDLVDMKVDVGDTLKFYLHNSDIKDSGIVTDTFTVVGTVTTPLYMTPDKETSTIDGLAYTMFAYVTDEAFDIDDYYIEVNVTIKGARALNSFDKSYEKLISQAYSEIKNIGTDRSKIRADELKEMTEDQLEERQAAYDAAKEEFDSQVDSAEDELIDGYAKLKASEAQLEDLNTFSTQINEAFDEQIAQNTETLRSTREQLEEASAQFSMVYQDYQELKNTVAQYEGIVEELDATRTELRTQIETLQQIEGTESSVASLQSVYNYIDQQYDSIKGATEDLSTAMASMDSTFSETKAQLSQMEAQLAESENQLNQARAEQRSTAAEFANQESTGKAEVEKGWTEYESGQTELETQKSEGQKQLADAAQQLIDARIEIEKLESADWYILDRLSNYGYASYASTVDSMEALGTVIPVFFLLVAILVCVTTMTRMVGEQRTIIGAYKALGYGDKAITQKYVIYVMIASVFGGVIGSIAGIMIFPYSMYTAWGALYTQPELIKTPHWGVLIVSFMICVIVMACTAYFTTKKELNDVPAALMRPKAPKHAKATFMERTRFWQKLSFSQKVTARNILRYKKRLLMTVVGIMGCTALLLAALGMNDTINTIVENQYNKIFGYDLEISFSSDKQANEFCNEFADKYDCMALAMDSFTVSNETHSETVTAFVTDDYNHFSSFVTIQERTSGDKLVPVDNGIIITEKLASNLGVGVGDYINVMSQDYVTKALPVTGIAENYVFHYIYMTDACYEGNYTRVLNAQKVLMELGTDAGTDAEKTLVEEISEYSGVTSAFSYTNIAADFKEQIDPIKSIVYVIILSAALLAFVVLYNLTNINISERIREIATIKVLGFKGKEVAMYIYRENAVMTIMGTIVGLVLGIGLHRVVIKSIEQSYLMYGYYISWKAYLLSVLLTFLFSTLVMLVMYRKLVNIPMIESLKSIE